MYIWTKSSAHRVYPNARPMQDDSGLMMLHCGKNMRASGQVLLRNFHDFTITGMDIEGIPADWCSFYRQECITYNDGMPYPDKLSENLAGVVKAYYTQSLWTMPMPDVSGARSLPIPQNTAISGCPLFWKSIP